MPGYQQAEYSNQGLFECLVTKSCELYGLSVKDNTFNMMALVYTLTGQDNKPFPPFFSPPPR